MSEHRQLRLIFFLCDGCPGLFLLLPLSWEAPSALLPLRMEVLLHQTTWDSYRVAPGGDQLVCTTYHTPLTFHWVMSHTESLLISNNTPSQPNVCSVLWDASRPFFWLVLPSHPLKKIHRRFRKALISAGRYIIRVIVRRTQFDVIFIMLHLTWQWNMDVPKYRTYMYFFFLENRLDPLMKWLYLRRWKKLWCEYKQSWR